jgi:hypothetical protein
MIRGRMKNKTIIAVIPAYNEGITIGSVVLGSRKYACETFPEIIQTAMENGRTPWMYPSEVITV